MDSSYRLGDDTQLEHCTSNIAGIIHDVKNLMCAVINTAELMDSEVPEEHPFNKKIQLISSLAQQCIELLSSSQSAESECICDCKPIELIPLINNVVSMVELRKDKRISIELSYNGLHPLVSGSKIELESALLNICINAIEAMSGSGTLRIGVSFLEKQDRQNICESAGTFTKCIKIEISDTGSGIAPESMPYIFDPFFTTKRTSDIPQRGMGLFRAKQCLSLLGGIIEVQSVVSQGTTFSILLPAMESS
ncbi:MAG TPA: HAMP domain-containing sensor histidine kinase [Chitinispirillaceae bacterium]|nr:HAMP domain-containing sensor histidine kinase [Chitinispirillaceae bacterium]